jgi:hypothetical protein
MLAETKNLRYAKALSHPMRVRILMAMNTPRREMSPKDFSEETDCALGNASYHFRKLHQYGCIGLTRTEQRRGATEHYYQPVKRALAWTEESRHLPPTIMDGFAATILRGFVEEAGAAIDSGKFNDREDRTLAWDKLWVDEQGWDKLAALFVSTLEQALEIEAECEGRRAKGAEGFYASWYLAAFPSPGPGPQAA